MSGDQHPQLDWVGDACLRIRLGNEISDSVHRRVRAACRHVLEMHNRGAIAGLVDLVPAYSTMLARFDVALVMPTEAEAALRGCLAVTPNATVPETARRVDVPVCYEGECAPDLEDVAAMHGRSVAEIVEAHAGAEYVVYFVGFAPGFAYLGGLPGWLSTPRLDKPRVRVPPGSVGIAGEQTGIYPRATPGGWRLIGRTPWALFDADRPEPAMLRMGDRVRFIPISQAEFVEIGARERVVQPCVESGAAAQAGGIRVTRAGMFTSVQDLGRRAMGVGGMGVPTGGAADHVSLRVGNRLLGNPDNAAGIEMTMVGGAFEFDRDAAVAVTGGLCTISIRRGAMARTAERGSAIEVAPGDELEVGPITSGVRAYLCIAGGINVPEVLGGRGTDVRAGFGGYRGRVLRAGDVLGIGPVSGPRRIWEGPLPGWARDPVEQGPGQIRQLRALAGPDTPRVGNVGEEFFRQTFLVSNRSDRAGVRLEGPFVRLDDGGRGRKISEGMAEGAVQVPPDGQPIVLGVDHPTTGGYPVVAVVASVDQPALGQLRPGDRVTFTRIERDEALALVRGREIALDRAIPPIVEEAR